MINYTDKESAKKLVSIEKNSLLATLDIQKNLNKQILVFMKNFVGNMEVDLDFDPENKAYYYMNESTDKLNKSNANITAIQKLIEKLDKIDSAYSSLPPSKIKVKIGSYNRKFTQSINSIHKNTSKIEDFIHEISLLDLSEFLDELKELSDENKDKIKEEEKAKKDFVITKDELDSSFLEDTLIISDVQEKVILPFKFDDIRTKLLDENDKYESMQDVIDKLYTVPIKNYKFSAVARFKETYKLITEREKASPFKALSFASELFFNYNLHPAIISACKNLDELDIYLACLDDNTLDEFKFFNIKYEITPAVIENKETWEQS